MHDGTYAQNKILIIEDDDLTLDSLVRHFKTAKPNYLVLTAPTFEAAMEALNCNTFAMILIDPGLPDFGAESEKANVRLSNIEKIINASPTGIHVIITGRFSSVEAEACRRLGAKAYLGKFGLNAPALANILEELSRTDFLLHRGTITSDKTMPEVHYPELSAVEELCLKWVASRSPGMKRSVLFDQMAKHFNMKNADSAEKKYKRARSKILAYPNNTSPTSNSADS
jgi:ActR/RegA family two-component response regulator